jgi:hypothetical protein
MYHERTPQKEAPGTVTMNESDVLAVSTLLAEASQLLATMVDGSAAAPEDGEDAHANPRATLEFAVKIKTAREIRRMHFSPAIFGEPGWDMLLSLFISEFNGPRLSVGRLTGLSGAPPTTALRWLDYLQKQRLVSRERNPTDARSDFIGLTEKGRTIMEQYLSETMKIAT